MGSDMREFFGDYTEEDLLAGHRAFAGGGVGTARPIILVEEKGATLTDRDGKEYIDCTSQAWSLGIGGCHPKVIAAVTEQIKYLTHVRTSFGTIAKLLLSKRLTDIAPGNLKKVSYCLHGSVANEGAMKLAIRNRPGRRYFLVPWLGYSGRTLSTIALSYPHPNNRYLTYMENVVRFPHAYCYRCPFEKNEKDCNLECLEYLEDDILKHDVPPDEVAAIIVEPIQGENGYIIPPKKFHQRLKKICKNISTISNNHYYKI